MVHNNTTSAGYKSQLPIVLITGTSLNGIGFETVRALAKHANLIVITGHNPDRLSSSFELGCLTFYLKTQVENCGGYYQEGAAIRQPPAAHPRPFIARYRPEGCSGSQYVP
jgi:NAD(P)-dependent dehydrogenase (short-subunit alcohol dehydrogenase family)